MCTIGRICNRCTGCVAMATTQYTARFTLITSRVSRRRREMYCGVRVCLCLCVCLSACLQPYAYAIARTTDETWGSGRGCPLVVHYWADLQSVHALRCYGNITRTRNVSEYTRSMPSSVLQHKGSAVILSPSAFVHSKVWIR